MKHVRSLILAILFSMVLLAAYDVSDRIGYWHPDVPPQPTEREYC